MNGNKVNNTSGWIYIGADCEKLNWCKVGKTDGDLKTRHRSAQNPNFFIYGAFQIKGNPLAPYSKEVLGQIEFEIHKQIRLLGFEAIKHFSTGSDSECYNINPESMMGFVESVILPKFSKYVHSNVYDLIADNYRFPDNSWWKDGERYFSNQATGMPPTLLGQVPLLNKGVPNYERKGIPLQNGYYTQSITPPIPLGGSIFVDQETGEQYDADELDDDDDYNW